MKLKIVLKEETPSKGNARQSPNFVQRDNRGVEPDVWKIEGLGQSDYCLEIVETAQRDGRKEVGCIVLGRGSNEEKVIQWLTIAAKVAGFIGFAVGRTSFWDKLVALRDGKVAREKAVEEIASKFMKWTQIFVVR